MCVKGIEWNITRSKTRTNMPANDKRVVHKYHRCIRAKLTNEIK